MSDNDLVPQKKDSTAVALYKTTSFVGWASVFLVAHAELTKSVGK
ncbi:MAG: hypothetical protein QX189_07580 [Methylococcales bacterium]